jgi:AraC-like DNA-binding protein
MGLPRRRHDLEVTSVGYVPRKEAWIKHHFDLFGVGFVVSGRGRFRVGEGVEHALEQGMFFTVYPGPRFFYGPEPGTTWEEYYVCFIGPGAKRLRSYGWFPQEPHPHAVRGLGPLVEIYREMIRVLKRKSPGDADRAALLAERLLLELYTARVPERAAASADPALEAVLEECRARFAEPLDFGDLARRHAMSYSKLRQRCRELVGAPPARYLARLRCEAARELLSDTDLSVKEIATRVGIADPYAFSRVFKRHVQLSPENFRRQAVPWAAKGMRGATSMQGGEEA